uniref:MADF domain-containing protein n=1 Tax=Anopheles minimus TaxID=112268 RepID=A0A182W0U3_9DIPT
MQRYENCKPKFVKEFIELYKSFPCLWHQQSKQYEHQKQKAYAALVQKYREVDPQASKETVKRKINALRTGYRKQLKRLNRPSKAGTNRQPTWWYFELFHFLDDYPQWLKQEERVESTNLESQNMDNVEYENYSDDGDGSKGMDDVYESASPRHAAQWTESCSSGSQGPSQPIGIKTDDDLEALVKQKLNTILQNDPSIVYGKHVAHKLRSLGEQQNKFAQKLINDIIFEAEMGSLSRSSTLVGMDGNELHVLDE